ncbi:MAG: single-stranded-DNA-specific exonuclease RecJ, partial [Rhodothermales bacterium]|nr:single-stranded-DNA-specific exonuclease RecJ [Rhodothermales bacterium]
MNYRWTLRTIEDEAAVAELAQALNDLPEPLARTLALRGAHSFELARSFFRDGLEAGHDPFLLKDMDRAADRLAEAISKSERVMVYGDYDVDGTTSAAMMTLFLREHGVEATYFVPNRFEHGYGLCTAGLDEAVERGASLVVALDCGITATEEADYAKVLGLDLVIADHHEPGPALPDALAVLDPKRADCPYPFTGLSGCGVGFKLVEATLRRLGRPPEEAHPYLDLLAVSIAADLVPVLGENRVLMRAGLERLRSEPRLGLRALAEVAGKDLGASTTSDIVFGLGPRINAAGRMGSADRAVELLLTDDPATARRLAEELEAVNRERRELDRLTLAEAIEEADKLVAAADPFALVLHRPHWHSGVIGIVASRIVERYYRPTILLTGDGDVVRGSARSIDGVSIHAALGQCESHLIGFGGHDAAAGVSLPRQNLVAFREALSAAIGEHVEPEQLEPELTLDAELDLQHVLGDRVGAERGLVHDTQLAEAEPDHGVDAA